MKYKVLGGRERESLFRQGGLKRKERKGKERWGGEKGVANEKRTRGEKRTGMNGKFE